MNGTVLLNARTGQVTAVSAKAVILCTSRPARIWLFSPEFPGISEFRPPQTTGDGHALAWRVGALKSEELLSTGLEQLAELRRHDLPNLKAHNPHELVRCLEVESILTNAELIILACRARRASSRELQFQRLDFPEIDPPEWNKFLVIENCGGKPESTLLPLDFAGDLAENYERYNPPSLGRKE